MLAVPPCVVCGLPSARLELVSPGQLPAEWDQWDDGRREVFQRHRDLDRWRLLFDVNGDRWQI